MGKIREVANYLHFGMTRNGQVRVHHDATYSIAFHSERFADERCFVACRPNLYAASNELVAHLEALLAQDRRVVLRPSPISLLETPRARAARPPPELRAPATDRCDENPFSVCNAQSRRSLPPFPRRSARRRQSRRSWPHDVPLRRKFFRRTRTPSKSAGGSRGRPQGS